MLEIISRAEAIARGLTRYFNGKPCKNGHLCEKWVQNWTCVECHSITRDRLTREKYKVDEAWMARDRERRLEKYASDHEYAERRRNYGRNRQANDPAWVERKRERNRIYQKQNRAKANAKWAKRHAVKLQATPSWLTKEHHRQIEAFYADAARLSNEAGEPWEVDHIVPLQGENVCGLHVPWNLRVIRRADNRSKGNKLLEAA